jgi:hypothetical protein
VAGGVRVLAVAALVGAALIAGCGGGGGAARRPAGTSSTAPAQAAPPAGTRAADPAAVRVIRDWVDAERRSDMARAATYFDLPTVVANGGPPLVLRTRAAVRLWNSRLPCGARLLSAVAYQGYTIARFRLTARPGERCDGTGTTASTAFKLRHGRIAQWVRVNDAQPLQPPPPSQPEPPAGGSTIAA